MNHSLSTALSLPWLQSVSRADEVVWAGALSVCWAGSGPIWGRVNLPVQIPVWALGYCSSFSETWLYSHFYTPSRLIITKFLCHCFATVHSLTNLKMQMNAKLQLNLNRLLLSLCLLLSFFLLCWEKKDTADIKCWWWKSIFQIWGNFKLGPSARDSDITRAAWLIRDLRRNSLDSILPLSLQREMNVAVFSSFPWEAFTLRWSQMLGRGIQGEHEQMPELKHISLYCHGPRASGWGSVLVQNQLKVVPSVASLTSCWHSVKLLVHSESVRSVKIVSSLSPPSPACWHQLLSERVTSLRKSL